MRTARSSTDTLQAQLCIPKAVAILLRLEFDIYEKPCHQGQVYHQFQWNLMHPRRPVTVQDSVAYSVYLFPSASSRYTSCSNYFPELRVVEKRKWSVLNFFGSNVNNL